MIHLFDLAVLVDDMGDPRPLELEPGWELDVEAVRAEIERRFPQVRFVELGDWSLMVANGAEPVPDDLADEIDVVILDLITADDTYYIETNKGEPSWTRSVS